jgi:citrate synthase
MTTAAGLKGVVVARTRLSKVDGQAGKLYFAGYDITDLAEHALFEEVIFLLWNNRLPTALELEFFKADLIGDMGLSDDVLAMMRTIPPHAHPMNVLRTAISYIGTNDPIVDGRCEECPHLDQCPKANRCRAQLITAKVPTIIAAWGRIREGQEPIAPRPDLSLAANFLYMLTGEVPDETSVAALNVYLVLLADHGFNASTFAARVTASTDSDIFSAVVSAIATLKGQKHGGANEAAMRMFIEIDDFGDAEEWFRQAVIAKRRIMGIGHRVYKVEDPRATILREYARALAASSGNGKWFNVAETIDRLARKEWYFVERGLYVNVDYYSAVVFYMLGIPIDMFTCMFAMSRAAGWTAHVIEQWADNQLIRPLSEYVGEIDKRWVPIKERSRLEIAQMP